MEHETARRLREIRSKIGLSQRQLAKAAGVANATISQIESGTLNPTVGTLKKVLNGIPISLGEFFADDFSYSEQVFLALINYSNSATREFLFCKLVITSVIEPFR
ncbi:MAG: helix-turn-helix transcriptional regulator [Porticoccaceae bacterium]|nr:helix-turn-helix transcriptional regulator [Porticoccaceae bacterium]